MRARLLIALAILATTLALPGAAGARTSPSAFSPRAEHDRIVAYWTPERIASAKSKDYVRDASGGIRPAAKPNKPRGGGSGPAVQGASWTGNGAVEQRTGRILFSTTAGNWICSGSVINSTVTGDSAVVLTAGHCVYDASGGWSFNFLYIPDFDDAPSYDCSLSAHGCWTATRLALNSDYYPSGFGPTAALRVDYGFALVGPGGKSGSADLDSVTGGYTLKTSGMTTSATQWAFGYPAAAPYTGNDLTYCKGSTINDPFGQGTWGMACNMTGGSSGGPWLTGTNDPASSTSPGQVSSLNSYRYNGLNYMFGPRFNSETEVVLADVQDGSATPGVSVVH